MSILTLKKVTVVGLNTDQYSILDGLQNLGCMHVVPMGKMPTEPEKHINPQAEDARKALRFLSEIDSTRRQIMRKDDFNVDETITTCLDLKTKIRRASDKKDFLIARLNAFKPWGNIQYSDPAEIDNQFLWFYQLPIKLRHALNDIELPWQIVGKDTKQYFVVVISPNEPAEDLLPVERVHLGAKSYSQLLDELEATELVLDELQTQRYGLTRYIYLLSVNIAHADNKAAKLSATQKMLIDDDIVALQGWVPEKKQSALNDFAQKHKLVLCIEKPKTDEIPPTLLEQSEKLDSAKDLAMFYQVPGYYGWDPSKLLFASFSLFFAMILADAGYGLVLSIMLLLYWKKFSTSAKMKSYRLLAISLTGCTILYGMLVGSYFGITPQANTLLGAAHILDIDNFDVMMKLSIIIGAIHIGIANISMAYVTRHKRSALAKVGWLFIIYGGLLYWLLMDYIHGDFLSYTLLGLGTVLVVIFTSERPITRPIDHLIRLADGLFSLKNSLNAFGDILSYMRLFALGLASASLAITFNGLASDVYEAVSGGGLLLAILILLIGHVLNFILGLMAGVVHGLRLNYIEFYNWGQAEEGTEFQPFARKEAKK
jgi:V/A-type H+-transporting ATPase subunit I